jgi:glycosyltransferase involved in cell wall biosynthesis
MQRKKIMVFCDYYLPGFKSGGGMWTVVNLVDRFKDRYDFFVVTRNHDGKADRKPYEQVTTGEWNRVGSAAVFYLGPRQLSVRAFSILLNEIKPDAVFLNSVFSLPSITFLRTRKSGQFSRIPVIVSPCGELAPATLKFKSTKKRLFLNYAKLAGLYKNVIWRASFELDAEEIKSAIGQDIEVLCAPDLPPKTILSDFRLGDKPEKTVGAARFVFVSRLVRKKNLHYLLERLSTFANVEIVLDVVGPIEDKEYWKECEEAARNLPSSVKLNVLGPMPYPETLAHMRSAHFFVLPTLTENFGYVFIEALACGSPMLISDRTVWNDVEDKRCGWTVPLEDPVAWDRAIRTCVEMDQERFSQMAKAAREYALNWLADPAIESASSALLERAIGSDEKRTHS